MCLIAFDWSPGSERPLTLVANRDEFHARPTRGLHWWSWPHGPLAGRDEQAGGSWLAVRRDGRFAVLTNVRDPGAANGARSRGELPVGALAATGIEALAQDVYARRSDYGPFNLLLGNRSALWQVGTHTEPARVERGLHALSNHALDTPWPKSIRAVRRLETLLAGADLEPGPDAGGEPDMNMLLGLLDDRSPAGDEELPDTGVGLELERLLSAPFIVDQRYGTRSSSALVLGATARLAERSFDPAGRCIGQRTYSWRTE